MLCDFDVYTTHVCGYIYIYIHTGCLVGLRTFPAVLVGLGTGFWEQLTILGQTPMYKMFSMSLVCAVGTFVSYFKL